MAEPAYDESPDAFCVEVMDGGATEGSYSSVSNSDFSGTSCSEGASTRRSRHDSKLISRQRKLLRLHHAATCPNEFSCPEVSHCMALKRLWAHINACEDDKRCPVPGCKRNRSALNHYTKCTDGTCLVCAPVKDLYLRTTPATRSSRIGYESVENMVISAKSLA